MHLDKKYFRENRFRWLPRRYDAITGGRGPLSKGERQEWLALQGLKRSAVERSMRRRRVAPAAIQKSLRIL
ncbi:hypothetical protein [Burkholderia pyrrocinia]|uniref:hypothetical protein n=1 Tax=Burkholderia pyrrocinia TaxID=60550 RepID=UPI0030CE021A